MAILTTGFLLVATIILAASSENSDENTECTSIQYVEIGTRGLIQCSFNETLFAIAWYNVNDRKGILLLQNGKKSGDGYVSGEFDIYPNGSLLINNVTTNHESVFRVTKAITDSDASDSYVISLHTTVKPAIAIPVIEECSDTYGTTCAKSTADSVEVNCFVRDSRPAVNLSWTIRTNGGDRILPSNYMNFTTDNVTYTSHVTATFSFGELSVLSLLVCRANSVPLNLVKEENVLLIEKEMDYTKLATPIKIYLNIHSAMNLSCTDLGLNLVVWKWSPQQYAFETLYISIFEKRNHTKISNKEYKLEEEGSLSLQSTLAQHEGLYSCVYDNGDRGGIVLYDVLVMVDPTPIFPVIYGCYHQQYCVLEKQRQDVLTCSVLGIRPKVTLEWRAFREETAIDFTQHQSTVTQMGDLYDVSLTVNFDFTKKTQNKVTVECRAVGENAKLFSLSTKIDLLFPNVPPTEQRSKTSTITIIAVLVVTMIIIITVAVVIVCRIRARKIKIKRIKGDDAESEGFPMLENDYSEKAERFIGHLKANYEILYDSVQPIPYIKDRMYCVDKIFVEGGIEYMTGLSEGKAQWDKLLSYQELVKEKCLKTKRQILEGEPGYGKSTLTLQLLYDWCKSLSTSPLKKVDVIIYLRLRQLGGVDSIFSAIRRFILPMDSDISEEDIKEILNQMKSVLVLLDGFDEYPDQESTETDIYHIMKKNMFQGFNVILTTRPSCVPQEIAPHSDRVRLTGFGEEARRKYVEKAVIGKGGKAVDKIMRKLQKNPVLDDLCQVPLFFVMFAHMTHEKVHLVTLNSVTSFFRFMIASFHSHMRNKMKDDNVEKFQLMENEHKDLDKIAFEALSGKNQKIIWDREQLRNQLGHEFYDQYIRIGILVEEEILNIPDTLYPQSHIQYKTDVRFYHKLFCEWYAAHYVAEQLSGGRIDSIHNFLQNLDPFDLQYVYRFACGLDKIAAGKIIQYLQNEIEGKKFAILCMLEQEDKTDRFIKTVSDLVSSSVTTINKDESKLLQRSTIQILDVASKKQVPISCLVLDKSLSDASDEGISLESGFHIPVLSTIKKIEIRSEKGTELTNDQMLGVVSYAQQCHKLTKLIFIDCLLPLSFSKKLLSSYMKSKHHQVMWQPSKHEFSLDISTGTWKLCNSQESLVLTIKDESSLPRLCSRTIYLRETDSRHVQSSKIVLLEVASSLNIPISHVCLKWSFSGFDGKDIRLESGLSLSSLSSVEKISINQIGKGNKLSEEEVIGLINYGIHSPRFKELWLDNCKLPSSINPDIIPEESRSRNIKVISSDHACFLDLKSGKWSKPDDIQTITVMCSDGLIIHRDTSESVQRSVIELLVEASNHDIPIYEVYLGLSFSKIDEVGNIILSFGLPLPIITSIERMSIQTEKERCMHKHEVNGILKYLQHSQRFKKLR
ncbi:putative NLR family CARD domain-containing protein 4 [Apostichopus japonicus]|uniref:Putative NLR family CARD domain-containing protein 4 n=1 Tax=Stichopus japonicus TaxID=307972 RepID=A0A2G8JZJ2_STIJA|nr:putative NLR family CARD domain-containing protein 4 [Apostichopus japonicus]